MVIFKIQYSVLFGFFNEVLTLWSVNVHMSNTRI